jgi:hypothetical protein
MEENGCGDVDPDGSSNMARNPLQSPTSMKDIS